MNAPNFSSVLDRPAESVEKPKPIPPGTYLFACKDQPRFDKSTKKGTEFVEFTCIPLQAGEDVDADALSEALTNKNTGEVKPLAEKVIKNTFYLTEDALWRLTEFLEHLGLDSKGKSIGALISETPGCQFLGAVVHKMADDKKNIFANIGQTSKVE